MSWERLEIVAYLAGTELHLDTNCRIVASASSNKADIVLAIIGPDGGWDGCPDVYHDDTTGEPIPMNQIALLPAGGEFNHDS